MLRTLLATGIVLSLVGCGSDSSRVDVWGRVTWKGQPVPDGFVILSPDATRGNSGPQGVAWIDNGTFDTRSADARGGVTGPLRVTVHGYDGKNVSALAPYGGRLFAPYQQSIEVPSEGGEINLVVSDELKAAPEDADDKWN